MQFHFGRTLEVAEQFLRRHIKPKAVAAAEKRRSRRQLRNAGQRLGRAAAVSGASGAGLVGYGMAVAPLGTAGLVAAGAATVLAAGAALLWPIDAGGGRISRAELMALVSDAEEWLLEKRMTLPGRVIPALDKVFFRLNDLNPHVKVLDPHAPLAWDLRRLLADHLPRLVHSYSELPATVRDEQPELLPRLLSGLETLDDELARICKEASRDHLLTFQAQDRFIETRYKDRDFKS